MSYEVLARKWRPQSFDDVVGQPHALQPLQFQLCSGNLHSAILFTGTRGVGKTSLARLFAKALNCETNGISDNPCNECSACKDIAQGRFPDLIEVDAASRTRVEDTLELLENANYLPSRGRFKIYLIDEVHMLSNSSFNALLKTLEEPPAHVKFILATTDPQKLPITVLSRCLQFSLRAIPQELISQHLAFILGEEKVEFDQAAVDRIAQGARGSMRDAQTLLDQAIAFGQGAVTIDTVNEMLGTLSHTLMAELFMALIERDADQLFQHLALAESRSLNYDTILIDMLEVVQATALMQFDRSPIPPVLRRLGKETFYALKAVSSEDLQIWYQIILQGRKDQLYAVTPYHGFEMTWIRLLAFKPTLIEHNTVIDWESESAGSSANDQPVAQATLVAASVPATTQHVPSAAESAADDSKAASTAVATPTESIDDSEKEAALFAETAQPVLTDTAPRNAESAEAVTDSESAVEALSEAVVPEAVPDSLVASPNVPEVIETDESLASVSLIKAEKEANRHGRDAQVAESIVVREDAAPTEVVNDNEPVVEVESEAVTSETVPDPVVASPNVPESTETDELSSVSSASLTEAEPEANNQAHDEQVAESLSPSGIAKVDSQAVFSVAPEPIAGGVAEPSIETIPNFSSTHSSPEPTGFPEAPMAAAVKPPARSTRLVLDDDFAPPSFTPVVEHSALDSKGAAIISTASQSDDFPEPTQQPIVSPSSSSSPEMSMEVEPQPMVADSAARDGDESPDVVSTDQQPQAEQKTVTTETSAATLEADLEPVSVAPVANDMPNEVNNTVNTVTEDGVELLSSASATDSAVTSAPAASPTVASTPVVEKVAETAPDILSGTSLTLSEENWPAICNSLPVPGYAKSLAVNCAFDSYDDRLKKLTLILGEDTDLLLTDMAEKAVHQALALMYGQDLTLAIEMATSETFQQENLITPEIVRKKTEVSDREQLFQSMKADPTLQSIESAFDLELQPNQIRVNKPKSTDNNTDKNTDNP